MTAPWPARRATARPTRRDAAARPCPRPGGRRRPDGVLKGMGSPSLVVSKRGHCPRQWPVDTHEGDLCMIAVRLVAATALLTFIPTFARGGGPAAIRRGRPDDGRVGDAPIPGDGGPGRGGPGRPGIQPGRASRDGDLPEPGGGGGEPGRAARQLAERDRRAADHERGPGGVPHTGHPRLRERAGRCAPCWWSRRPARPPWSTWSGAQRAAEKATAQGAG